MEKQLHSDVCDVIHSGLDCLWLECGIDKHLYDISKEFAELMDSVGGIKLLKYLNRSDTIKRINK